jgi:hypothetical protein
MKVNHEKLLRALLAKAYKMQDGEIDEILNSSDDNAHDTGLQTILDKDAARITALKTPKAGTTFQDGYKKGKSEVLSEFEKDLKEKFDIESDAQGIELVEAVISSKVKAGKPKDLTDDDIKRHPVYQNLEKTSKKALADKETEFTTKLTEQEKGFKKAQTFQTVGEKALTVLDSLNPVLSSNPKVAATQRKTFLDQFKGFEFEIQGDRVLVSKDGKLLEDGHGHSMEFDALVKQNAADYFDFKANNGGKNAGNGADDKDKGTPPAGGQKGYPAGFAPKTFAEVAAFANDSTKPIAERQAAAETWAAEHPDS